MDDENVELNEDPTPTPTPDPPAPNTILADVKRRLGIQKETTEFDLDVCSSVNTAFFTLFELGIGPSTPFYIDATTEWSAFETSVPQQVVLDYLWLKTKLVFDPPASSQVIEAYKDRISELEFRMNILVDNGGGVVSG